MHSEKYIGRIYDSMKRLRRLSAYSPYAPRDVEVHVSPVTVIRVWISEILSGCIVWGGLGRRAAPRYCPFKQWIEARTCSCVSLACIAHMLSYPCQVSQKCSHVEHRREIKTHMSMACHPYSIKKHSSCSKT